MTIDRRALIMGGIGLAGAAAGTACAKQSGQGSAEASGEGETSTQPSTRVSSPAWPPRERIPLWPGRPPGSPATLPRFATSMAGPPGGRELHIRGVAAPEICVYRPARPDGTSVLVVPGGGYGFVSFENEGHTVAERLAQEGTTAFVLVYRLPGEGWPNRGIAPLQDGQRAMRVIRSKRAELGIDPAKLGVVGFSAGGHLAADLAVSHAGAHYTRVDAGDEQSARPAFAGLIYPVVDLRPLAPSGRPVTPLLGANASAAQLQARSPVAHVTRDTPPCFLLHAFNDRIVPAAQSLGWIEACARAGVPVEAHLLAEGNHGFGVRNINAAMPGSRWPDLFELWFRRVVRARTGA